MADTTPTSETTRQRYEARHAALKQERASWLPHWRELADFFSPRRGRWLSDNGQPNRGDRRNTKLIDGTPRYAARTLASGMMAGLTSPARPWFRLSTPDPAMMELAQVKGWIDETTRRMQDVFARSNLYNVLPTLYGELGVFGTAPILVAEDADEVIRCYPFTVGSYSVGLNAKLQVDTFFRAYKMTVRQMVEEFGLNACSRTVRGLWDSNQREQWIDVTHMIAPNDRRERDRYDNKNMAIASCYYEAGGDPDIEFLRRSGFNEPALLCPRWDVTGEDIYGASPAMDALGDAKALQLQQKRKAQAIDKHVDPPMVASAGMRNQRTSLLPGDVTYVDGLGGQGASGFQPAYTIKPEISGLIEDIRECSTRIDHALYKDLFLMLAMSDRRDITAREVEERHEEKLLMLGPVLERLNDELLDPLIDRTFAVMLRRGMIPPPPQALQGIDLKVEYISILAQAQRAVAVNGLERLAGFVGSIAAVSPEIVDKVDWDQMVDEYGAALGTPSKVIKSDDDVALVRQGRQQQQAAQMTAMAAQPMAQAARAAKDASETEVNGTSVLDQIMGARAAAPA